MNKLAMGTAQFGLDYGINNKQGKIPLKEIFKILDTCLLKGIDTLDTAPDYGDSEKKIGEYTRLKGSNFKIISKLPVNVNSQNLDTILNKSLSNLQTDKIYGIIFHNFQSYTAHPQVLENLYRYQEKGVVKKIGFSFYYNKNLELLLSKNIKFDIVQVPYSIFDGRFATYFPDLKKRGVEIHVRSVFLQGLVFKKPAELEDKFKQIKPKLEKLNALSQKINEPVSSLCLNFVLANNNIDKTIIGIDSEANLRENLKVIQSKNKINQIYQDLKSLVEDDENIILPFNWNQKKIVCIIQARTGSTRLPKKVLLKLKDKTVLEHVVYRVKKSRLINEIIVATTLGENDDELVNLCKKKNILYFRGSENDVLDRYYQTAQKYKPDHIVRITSDCPVIDPNIIDQVIELHLKSKAGFTSNIFPPTFPDGLDVEIFTYQTLKTLWEK